jgi:hypothetical protein
MQADISLSALCAKSGCEQLQQGSPYSTQQPPNTFSATPPVRELSPARRLFDDL